MFPARSMISHLTGPSITWRTILSRPFALKESSTTYTYVCTCARDCVQTTTNVRDGGDSGYSSRRPVFDGGGGGGGGRVT